MSLAILATLVSHWRRRPGQLLALIAGLAVATALWSGVQALNAEARASYDRAAAVLGGDQLAALVAADGGGIAPEDHVALRRAGWRVSPVIEGVWRPDGQRFRLLGVDALSLPPAALGGAGFETAGDLGGFLTPPYRVFASAGTIARLEAVPGAPGAVLAPDLPAGVLIADIALAQRLLSRDGRLDRLVIAPGQKPGIPPITAITGDRLERVAPQEEPELARLTDSFHLNLTAFGLLSFVVGLFIVHATIGLAFEQRRPMLRTLCAIGVSRGRLGGMMLLELGLLATIAAAIGMSLGYLMAASLLPDVAASLRGLYGAEVAGQLSLRPGWWAAGFAMTLAGTLVASAGAFWKLRALPVLATAQTEAWHGAQSRTLRLQGIAAALLALAAVALAVAGSGLIAGFALMGAVLIAAALALPGALAGVIKLLRGQVRGPVAEWFVAESRAQIGGLSLALMALLLALSVNIGVGAMVSSFRTTFLGWLDQRLAAELYVRGRDGTEAAEMETFLQARDDVLAVLPVQHTDMVADGWPYELFGIRDDAMYRENWPLVDATPDAWDSVAAGDGILLSEQFARRLELGPGDAFQPQPGWEARVVGIYPDYGNPLGQAITSEAELNTRWPDTPRENFAVRLVPGAAPGPVLSALESRFAPDPQQAVDQAALKSFSRDIFERTFAVTLALNVLTFAVAGLALLTSLLTLAGMRLPQLAPLWAMGLTRAQLGRLELLRALFLALLTAILAIPLGILVAWILLAVINVEAFGWRIPLRHYPGQWAALVVLAVLSAGIAAALPAGRLRRTPPALLLRVFADAR
ncbi:FtsX-like permease family protein [Halovulum dunhuangense]|nr:FtsX-like permease family protein [Halovulum dunhuangense]